MAATVSPGAQPQGTTCKLRNSKGSKVQSGGGCQAIEGVRKLSRKIAETNRRNIQFNEKTSSAENNRKQEGGDVSKTSELAPAPQLESQSAMKCNKENEPTAANINPFWADKTAENHPMIPYPRPPRKVELRGGDLFTECLCLKWNGLQQDCPKLDCQGQDLCMTWPMPKCQPSGLGVPIVPEPRLKRPVEPECDKPADGTSIVVQDNETAENTTRRRLVQMAREQYPKDQPPNPKQFRPCKMHDGRYRLRPLMRNKVTQTDSVSDVGIGETKEKSSENVPKEEPSKQNQSKP